MHNIRKKIKNKLTDYYWKLHNTMITTIAYWVYDHCKIDENMVFMSSRDGMDLAGNILRIAEELSKEKYNHLKIYIYAKHEAEDHVSALKKEYQLENLHIVTRKSIALALMERAKYIVSDSGIPWSYVKREDQVMLNTWHGTPLKFMGKYIKQERHSIGTVQHFFLSSDYLLYPSEYMKEKMLESYMVENVMAGKVLMGGYPRNSVFFDHQRRQELRDRLGYTNLTVYAYLPTHRGNVFKMKNKQQLEQVIAYLTEIDAELTDDQILLVKLHIFNQSKIDFAQFEHIKPFPTEYETYDVLNATDGLITDYSSVFFDYANTRNKIILFTYDEEEYFEDRGTYFSLDELPFPKVKNAQELIREMNTPINYDDQEFLARFCPYDHIDATEELCDHVFTGKKQLREETVGNGKENVLIMGGSLAKNGITTALVNLLNNLDTEQKNYYVTFRRDEINRTPERVNVLPPHIKFLPMMNENEFTLWEKLVFKKYKKSNKKIALPTALQQLFKRERERYFPGVKFDHVLQFDGYGINVNLLFDAFDCKKTVWVHNDMVQEINTKKIQHYPTLFNLYNRFDHVAVVSEDMIEPTAQISGRRDNIKVVHNIHDVVQINERAQLPITLDMDTEYVTANPNGIVGVLESPGKKFITIGRFSPEKGHQRLIAAFDAFCHDYPDTQLIILGGHGVLYNKTLAWRRQSKYWRNITIIKSVLNPMPILKKCDLFVLSSFYEGLGLVLLEADCLDVPSFTTEISGASGFYQQHCGYIVENSEAGILQGMYDYMDGKVHCLEIDYDQYNQKAMSEFEDLFGRE